MNHSKETVLKTVSELFDLVKEKQSKIDDLQKRVDAALKMISINRGFAWGSVSISQLEQALKGDQ